MIKSDMDTYYDLANATTAAAITDITDTTLAILNDVTDSTIAAAITDATDTTLAALTDINNITLAALMSINNTALTIFTDTNTDTITDTITDTNTDTITDTNTTDTITDTILTDMTIADSDMTNHDSNIDYITAAMTAATIDDMNTVSGSTSFHSELFKNQSSIIIDNMEEVNRRKIIKKKHDDSAVLIHEYVYDDDVMLKCKLCEDIFLSNKEFNKHAKTEHEIKCLCFGCSEVFQDKYLYGNHINRCHLTYCTYCTKRIDVEESLEKHILEFHSNSQETNKDSEIITLIENLNIDDELREIYSKENINTTISTNVNDGFFLHETFQDDSDIIIKCRVCEKIFKCLTTFRYHARSEHNYEWLCSICCLVFSSGKIRGRHMRNSHKKNYSCTLCIRRFYDSAGLLEHYNTKHRGEIPSHIPTAPIIPIVPSPPSSESFIHEIIPYDSSLDRNPPYQLKCKICEKVFKNHPLFNRHAQTLHNSGFLCTFCSQIFHNRRSRKTHVRKEHSFTCQVCKKSLRSEKGLQKHLEIKHGQMNINSYREDSPYEPIAARLRSRKMRPKDGGNENKDSVFNDYDNGTTREHYHEILPQTSIPSTSISSQTSIPSQTSSESQTATAQEAIFMHEIIPNEIPNQESSYKLKCKICEKIFDTHLKFNEHARTSHKFQFLCSLCSQIFTKKKLRRKHERQEHVYICQVCGRKLRDENGLMDHSRAKHGRTNINLHQTETAYSSLPQLPQLPELLQAETSNSNEPIIVQDEDEMDEDKDSFFDDYGTRDISINDDKTSREQFHTTLPQTSNPSQTSSRKSFICEASLTGHPSSREYHQNDINNINSHQDTSYEPIAACFISQDMEMSSVSYDRKGKYRKYDSIKEDDEPEVSFKKFKR